MNWRDGAAASARDSRAARPAALEAQERPHVDGERRAAELVVPRW